MAVDPTEFEITGESYGLFLGYPDLARFMAYLSAHLVSGDLGDLTGDLTGDVTGNVTGPAAAVLALTSQAPDGVLVEGDGGAIIIDTSSAMGADDHIVAVRNHGTTVWQVHASGAISLAYSADLVAGGAGTPTSASSTFTPPTSATATCVINGVSFTATFNSDADTTVNDLIALIAADLPTIGLVTPTLVSHKMLVTPNAPGLGGNGITTTSNAAHGASFDKASTSGGLSGNATVNTPSGRIVMAKTTQYFTVLNSAVTATTIVQPIIESFDNGGCQVVNPAPFAGGFTLFGNGVCGRDVTVSFTVTNP